MTHEYEGRYRAKHAPDTTPDSTLANQVSQRVRNGRLTCAAAFAIVKHTGASPSEVGRAADLLEIKITRCQLGLFGHSGEKRNVVEPAVEIQDGLEQDLRNKMVKGKLPCREAWEIASRWGVSKRQITVVCEKLMIRLGPCQLGVF
jgi:hypothetical protein